MTADPASRPIGWWLKEADARLDEAFDRALAEKGRTRREWQVLSTLAARPTGPDELAQVLAAFGPAESILGLVRALEARGEITSVDGMLRVTDAGARTQADLTSLVAGVRQRVSAALPEDDYVTLVRLLSRLVEGLTEP